MNFEKNPRQSERLAKERKKLEQIAKRNPNRLSSKDRAKLNEDLEFDNVDDTVFDHRRPSQDDSFARE